MNSAEQPTLYIVIKNSLAVWNKPKVEMLKGQCNEIFHRRDFFYFVLLLLPKYYSEILEIVCRSPVPMIPARDATPSQALMKLWKNSTPRWKKVFLLVSHIQWPLSYWLRWTTKVFPSSAGVSPCISLKIKKRHNKHHMIETHR